MIINHNMNALNAHRNMTGNTAAAGKSMEKLSSGLRINKAGDDAAGLAISEKMRGQIRGLDQANRNAQDGISMIQTAEGALNETHSILQRMRELAVQSSNDTNVAVDRNEIQKEMDELAKEVTRIANNTEFNTQKLINGGIQDTGIKSAKFHVGANANQDITLSINAMDAKSLGVSRDVTTATVTAGATDVTGVTLGSTVGTAIVDGASLSLTANDTAAKTAWAANAAGMTGVTIASTADSSTYNGYTIVTTTGGAGAPTASIDAANKTITLAGSNTFGDWTAANINTAFTNAGIGLTATGNATAIAANAGAVSTTDGLAADEVKLTVSGESVIVKETATSATFTGTATNGLTVKLDGSLSASTAATITIDETAASAATFASNAKTADAVTEAGIDVSTQTAASSAITTIQTAIETVSAERSKLGAYANRLEHTANNLGTASENLTSAESRIRDVDMAKEMMTFSKNNILSQAAQAMISQANQQPQGVLQLLR
ncbi:flagellin [Clostridium swellfunianum]|uniref:flagellin N-terminal helical domain-containing protein n=1 Tax=Clostridium swellfunianum TaxID=1367462 RepID=UPI00203063F2|nr:flagellin [Clostridium swellfunianum]MCM0650457.1 flagellin [Clostridium swellfunianum]